MFFKCSEAACYTKRKAEYAYLCHILQVTLMEPRQAVDCGSMVMAQKHDNRINKAQELLDIAGDTKKGETDDLAVVTGSTPGANSSPACQEVTRRKSVEKFVYETDKSRLPVTVHVDPVSNSFVTCISAPVTCRAC